ncbi:MAG TPA: RICIN domain-containing protein [Trebonia sp.]|nr:RICIN domain-containing protein [Trebonia sp.]
MNDRKFRPELRVLAALVLAVAVAFWFTRSGSPAPPAGTGPGLRVNFAAGTHLNDPAAIGADDAAGGLPDTGSAAAAVRTLLRKLRLGYSGTSVSRTGQSADRQVTLARDLGQAPVVSIPDTVTAAAAAALVRRFRAGPASPVRRWLITAATSEGAAAYSARFNALCDAMKAAAPGVSVGGGPPAGYDQPFLRAFLRASGTRADSVGFAFYGEQAAAPKTGGQLAAALTDLSADLRATRSLIDAAVPARAAHIAIDVNGWNIADGPASVQFTGFAAMWDADLLGRVLAAGATSLAAGARGGLLYGGQTEAPRAYQVGSPTPLYAAIGMFTGEGLFPRFGADVVTATSALPGVDVFASAAPDEVVVVSTASATHVTVLRVSGDAPLRATQWRLTETNGAVSAPVNAGTATSRNGSFRLSLPPGSVTTVVVTADGTSTGGGAVTVANASTGQCLAGDGSGGVATARCGGAPRQRWRLAGTTLVNEQSGRCLDGDAAGRVSAGTCDGSAAENWYNLGGRLVSAPTSRCLNGNSTAEVYALACDGASQQNWTLRNAP